MARQNALHPVGHARFGRFQTVIQQFLVLGFRFGEPNVAFVQVLLAIFDLLLAGLFGLFKLLRFEANFGFALFVS